MIKFICLLASKGKPEFDRKIKMSKDKNIEGGKFRKTMYEYEILT
jgi:hypothetical protein